MCLNRLGGPVNAPEAYLTFYAAVALSAWCGGLGPALLAAGASTLGVGYVLVAASRAVPGITGLAVVLRLVLFSASAGLVGWVVARARGLRRDLAARTQERTSAVELAEEVLHLRAFMLDSMVEGVSLVDRDGMIRLANPALEVMFGYEPGELAGRHVSLLNDYPPDENQQFVAAIIQEARATGAFSGEFNSRKKDGTPFITWARIGAVSIAGEEYFLGLQHDITERKRAEAVLRQARDDLEMRVAQRTADLTEANARLQHEIAQREHAEQELRQAEHRYRTLVEQLPAVTYIWMVDDGNRLVYVSPQIESMTGFSAAECLADPELWIRQIHPDDRSRVLDQAAESILGTKAFSCDYRLLTRDGQVCWVSDQSVVVRDEAGRPLFRRGVQIDITARKEAELEFENLSARATDILERISAPFITVDSEARITYVNPGMERLAGQTRGALIGKPAWEVFPKARETVFWKQYERVRIEQMPLDAESYYVPLGKWLKVHMYPTGSGVSSLVEDITEQHRTEVGAISGVLHALNAHVDVREAFPTIATNLRALTLCDMSALVLFDDKTEWATVTALSQPFEELGAGVRFRTAELPGARDVFAGLPHLAQDLVAEAQFPVVQLACALGFRSAMWLPVRGEAGTVGAVGLMWRRYSGGSTVQLPLLGEIAAAIGLAVRKSRLFDEVHAKREQLKMLSQRLIELQETERRHIARELHDEIGQQLTGLKLLLDTVQCAPAEAATGRLREAGTVIQDLLGEVRNLSLELRPAMLDDFGLLPALLWLFDRYRGQTGVRVNFEHAGLEERVPEALETAAYRIVQEALTNAARHAGVGAVAVRASKNPGVLRLEIVDHGAGFDRDGVLRACQTGGIVGMRERAALLGGRMTIESTPGAGTRLTAEFPLPEDAIAG
jgi:PAS domain S-box-containing protein